MSIIYEALKKVEQHLPFAEARKEKKATWIWLAIAVIFIGFIGCGIAIVLLFSSLKPPLQIIQQAPSTPAPAVAPSTVKLQTPATSSQPLVSSNLINPPRQRIADNLDLNGIMDMEGERIALINNQILKVGDYIQGARVMRISQDTVELLLKDKIIILKIK